MATKWSSVPVATVPPSLDAVTTVMTDIINGSATITELIEDVSDVVDRHDLRRRVLRTVQQLNDARALVSSPDMSTPERQRQLFVNPAGA